MRKKKGIFVSKVPLNIDVLIEVYGITTQWLSLIHTHQLKCKNFIRNLHGTNNKITNNLHYKKTSTLLEQILEQYQTPFTVYQINKKYTAAFTFLPAHKDWICDPSKNAYHNCPAHHQFEVNFVCWRLEVSGIELTYDDTENVMNIDEHNLPCYSPDGFCKPTTKTPLLLFGLTMIFA